MAVHDEAGSNQVGTVRVGGRPVLVLKRSTVVVGDLDPCRTEIEAYRWLARVPATATLAPRLVGVVGGAMVLEAVPGGRPVHGHLESHHDPTRVLEALGRSLALLHSATPDPGRLKLRRPWVLNLERRGVPEIFSADPEIHALVGRIVGDPSCRAALDELAGAWAPRGPMHGDLKFDNALVTPGPDGDGPSVVLVDWELAGLGLPAWDVAGLLDGLIVPAAQCHGRDEIAGRLEPAWAGVAAYRWASRGRVPDDRQILVATVVRLLQSSIQLHAMRHMDPGCAVRSDRVLEAARLLAREVGEGGAGAAWVA